MAKICVTYFMDDPLEPRIYPLTFRVFLTLSKSMLASCDHASKADFSNAATRQISNFGWFEFQS